MFHWFVASESGFCPVCVYISSSSASSSSSSSSFFLQRFQREHSGEVTCLQACLCTGHVVRTALLLRLLQFFDLFVPTYIRKHHLKNYKYFYLSYYWIIDLVLTLIKPCLWLGTSWTQTQNLLPCRCHRVWNDCVSGSVVLPHSGGAHTS